MRKLSPETSSSTVAHTAESFTLPRVSLCPALPYARSISFVYAVYWPELALLTWYTAEWAWLGHVLIVSANQMHSAPSISYFIFSILHITNTLTIAYKNTIGSSVAASVQNHLRFCSQSAGKNWFRQVADLTQNNVKVIACDQRCDAIKFSSLPCDQAVLLV